MMRGIVLITFACIGMASSIMMPDQTPFMRECPGRKVYPDLNIQWLNAETTFNLLGFSKNVQYFLLSKLLGSERVQSISEEEAAATCFSMSWSDKMTANIGITNGAKNMDWVVHRNPYRPGTADTHIRGEYAYSSVVRFSDNASFTVVEWLFPDGTRGFVVGVSKKAVITQEAVDMIKMKVMEMGFAEDQQVSVRAQCAKNN